MIKAKYLNPYIILCGDFNKRNFSNATADTPSLKALTTPPTRGSAVLDIIGTNFNDLVVDAGVTDPLFSDSTTSDHSTVFASFRMPRVPTYSVDCYSYYHLTPEGDQTFGEWLDRQSWNEIDSTAPVSQQVDALHSLFECGMRFSYQKKTRKKKTSEPPWMTDWLRALIRRRRSIFQRYGRN